MKAGGVIATMIASYLAGKVLYGTGKAISRALGGYPSKEVEKKIDALQPKLNVMFKFYESKNNTSKISDLENLNKRLSNVITEEDYLEVEIEVEKFWNIYKKEQKN